MATAPLKKDDKIKEAAEKIDSNKQNEKSQRKSSLLPVVLALLTTFIIVFGIVGALSYYVIHKNINNVATKYKDQIATIPLLKYAIPLPVDFEDPQYLSEEEIKVKYQLLREQKKVLQKEIEDAKKIQEENKKVTDELNKVKKEKEAQDTAIKEKEKIINSKEGKLVENQKKFEQMVANQDKEGIKTFFEQIDPKTAELIYKEVMGGQKEEKEAKAFIGLFEGMDAASSSAILEKMNATNEKLVVEILKRMKKDNASQLLQAMTPTTAAKVSEKLSEFYLKKD